MEADRHRGGFGTLANDTRSNGAHQQGLAARQARDTWSCPLQVAAKSATLLLSVAQRYTLRRAAAASPIGRKTWEQVTGGAPGARSCTSCGAESGLLASRRCTSVLLLLSAVMVT